MTDLPKGRINDPNFQGAPGNVDNILAFVSGTPKELKLSGFGSLVPPLPPNESAKAWADQLESLIETLEAGEVETAKTWLRGAVKVLRGEKT